MQKTARKRPFQSRDQINERDALLISWLTPNTPDTKVINGVRPTFKQLANWLSTHFNIHPALTEGAVRRYERELGDRGNDLPQSKLGRRRTANSPHESAPPRKPPVSKKSDELTLLAQLAAEAIQLTGLSPSALHETFKDEKKPWNKFLGSRSGFFYRLQKKLDAKKPVSDTSSLRPDDDVEHSLRLYQITLRTADQRWCAFLFGYEPRTHFLNAACYVAHQRASGKKGPGRPVKLLDTTEQAKLTTTNGLTSVQLPADVLLEFVFNSRELMALPVDNVYLSSTLGDQENLMSQLYALAPESPFSAILVQHHRFLAPNAGQAIPVTSLCRKIETLLNQHYEKTVFPDLIKYQSRLDEVIEEFFHIKRHTSGHHEYRRRKPTSMPMNEDERNRLLRAKDWVAFRTEQNEQLHVKHRLRVAPINLSCDDYRAD